MKNELILLLYDTLICGKTVERKSFCSENKISERTFYRYMREISLFFIKHKHNTVTDVREPDGEYYAKENV